MSEDTYGIRPERALATARAPELSYRPRIPKARLGIGLIGCGGISQSHLRAYRKGGYNIVALCSRDRAKADARRAEFFPEAEIVIDYRELLAREDVAVVDIATHADVRPPLIEAALRSGKHVLSQKPFVLELKTGERLVRMAEAAGLRLAVNQNGRWAPHFAWMREAIEAGLVGEISSADFAVHWDHHWIVGTDFEAMPHLILSDFAIHWFDIATVFFGTRRAAESLCQRDAVQKDSVRGPRFSRTPALNLTPDRPRSRSTPTAVTDTKIAPWSSVNAARYEASARV